VTSELLDQATRLFAEKGYESTTLSDIASALNISRPALYNYVSSKDDLLVMLVEQVSGGFAEVMAQLASRKDRTPTQKIRDVVALIVRQRAEHPDQFRILDRTEPVLPEPLASTHLGFKREILTQLTKLITDGIASGEFRRVDGRTTALTLLGMCNWVAWWFRPGNDIQPVVDTVTDLALAMLTTGDSATGNADTRRTIGEIRSLLDRIDPNH
jgi:AcrR family transcriptional regulator